MTVLYHTPEDPWEFEHYYTETHMPLVHAVIKRAEVAVGIPGLGGRPPPFYRITEYYFDSLEQLKQITATPEWQKIVDQARTFASAGTTILLSEIT